MPWRDYYANRAGAYDTRWRDYTERTLRAVLPLLEKLPEGPIVDVGCGTGTLLAALAQRFPNRPLFGIDPSDAMLAAARHKLARCHQIRLIHSADVAALPRGFCAAIACTNTLHYLPRPRRTLQQCADRLMPGVVLVLEDYVRQGIGFRLIEALFRLVDRCHQHAYRIPEVAPLLTPIGLSIEREHSFALGSIFVGHVWRAVKGR